MIKSKQTVCLVLHIKYISIQYTAALADHNYETILTLGIGIQQVKQLYLWDIAAEFSIPHGFTVVKQTPQNRKRVDSICHPLKRSHADLTNPLFFGLDWG